jgi:cytidine deaminase
MADVDPREQFLASADAAVARAVDAVLPAGEPFRGVITAAQAEELAQRMGTDIPGVMLALVPFARLYALPVISKFKVGAVSRGASTGNLYYGANMEYLGEALSFTVHAEQSSTTNAWLNGEDGLTMLAISAAPCGYCRQFLYEIRTADQLGVLLPGEQPVPLTSFLPQAFGPSDLGVTAALMSREDHGLTLEQPSEDPVVLAALDAANQSYAPYSSGYAGVGIRMTSGAMFAGRYAENAAFNPSMSPLESALTMWSMCGNFVDEVEEAVLVTVASETDQTAATAAVLSAVAPSVELQVLRAS